MQVREGKSHAACLNALHTKGNPTLRVSMHCVQTSIQKKLYCCTKKMQVREGKSYAACLNALRPDIDSKKLYCCTKKHRSGQSRSVAGKKNSSRRPKEMQHGKTERQHSTTSPA